MKATEREFPVTITEVLSKDTTILSSDFVVTNVSKDEDGYLDEDVSLDNINTLADYSRDHYTPLELIEQLNKLTELLLSKEEKVFRLTKSELQRLRFLNKESEGWIGDETQVLFD